MIEFRDVSKVYENGTVGLDHVNLSIQDSEFLAVIGLSGAGKSTMLRSINRLNEISEGEIFVDGSSITKASRKQLRKMRTRIGMISQTFNLVKRSTVQRNVLSGKLGSFGTVKSIFGLFSQADYDLCTEMLKKVGLEKKLHSRCDELSGGQQQRVSIARTLFQEADIILADEPVASLDPVTSKAIMEDLKKINTEMNKTIVINIHSVSLAREYATRIIGMRSGKIVFDGTPKELNEEKLRMIYQGEEK
ncbi:MAG: phosphonate ABC transporter ATP-binding protein [Lactimicrobium massiliense]|nr:phosphonate ABC transporter ATP-binding protein [Lactimicrobium massiliense]MDD6230400.1 phosphonate ABC transporter ATP-binding protein [Lactimicrobium massiliense]MDD6561022.1 phosphonate ABC transporter ATP-binding protein [Lactimicrobium massiliense]